jgi:hypothetical protein
MKIARVVLVSIGALGIVLGAWVLQDTVRTTQIWGLVSWLIFAVIIHDGIISPVVVGISIAMRRRGRRIPAAVLAILQGGILIGSVFTLIVVPEIIRKAMVPKNYTVLPFEYGPRLALLWAGILVATALAVLVYLRATRRQKTRPQARQV